MLLNPFRKENLYDKFYIIKYIKFNKLHKFLDIQKQLNTHFYKLLLGKLLYIYRFVMLDRSTPVFTLASFILEEDVS